MRKISMKNRILSLVLAFVMVLGVMPMTAFAAAEDNLCDHHPIHTAECGYAAALTADETTAPSTESAPVCDCGTDDAAIHATTCAVYVAPENPQCFCVEKCTALNEWCDVCGFDVTDCTGGWDEMADYASTPAYIANIGIAQDGSIGSTGVNDCKNELSGHTIIDRDLNDGAGGDYIYMGYKTTTDPSQAITGIVFRVGENPPNSITYNGYTFYLVGGSNETNTASQGGAIDLNAEAGGDYIYTYVTRDSGYGAPLTAMTVNESSSYSGWTIGTNTSGGAIDLNQDAGGDYLYLHYQRFSATVTATYWYLDANGNRQKYVMTRTIRDHTQTVELDKTDFPSHINYNGKTYVTLELYGRDAYWRDDDQAIYGSSGTTSVNLETSGKVMRMVYVSEVKFGQYNNGAIYYIYQIGLNYDTNGGSGTFDKQEDSQVLNAGANGLTEGDVAFELHSHEPTHDSQCSFLGWSTDKNAATGTYQPGETIYVKDTTTLYAIWDSTHTRGSYTNLGDNHSYNCPDCGKNITEDHSFDGTTLLCVCGAAHADTVATVSKNGKVFGAYTTLDAAITAAESCTAADKAVVMIMKKCGTNGVWVIESGEFTLDLNGKSISSYNAYRGTIKLLARAKLTVKDSGSGGYINNNNKYGYGIEVGSNASLTVIGGEICSGKDNYSYTATAIVNAGICTVSGGVITGRNCIENTGSCTISGGTFNARSTDIVNNGACTLSGGVFLNSIYVTGCTLSELLAPAYAYWAGDTMLTVADNVSSITGKGDITVKPACTHESGTKSYTNNGDDHTYSYSCCNLTVTEAHSYTDCVCLCGADIHEFDEKGFCVNNENHYEPAVLNGDVYEISNAGQLMWFAELVNAGNFTASAVLTNDIDMDGLIWTPIGTETAYTGTLDGKGFAIKNLWQNSGGANGSRDGLVVTLGTGGAIMGVTVDNAAIWGADLYSTNGVGVIANRNYGTISDCVVKNSSVQQGAYEYLGGIAGENSGTIENCAVIGCSFTRRWGGADSGSMGAVTQTNNGTVKNCFSYGCSFNNGRADKAAIVAVNNGTLDNCYYYTTSTVADTYGTAKTTTQFATGEVAYLLGEAWGQTSGTDDYPILSGAKVYYGYVSCADDAQMEYTNNENASAEKPGHTGGNQTCMGYQCEVCGTWYGDKAPENHVSANYTNGFRDCCGAYQPATDTDNDGVYEIANAGQLYWFAAVVNSGYGDVAQNRGANAILTADITVNEDISDSNADRRTWTPVGRTDETTYYGTFDGKNHIISGLYFNDSTAWNVGLFGYTRKGGTVQNVGIVDSFLSGEYYVGGVVGCNTGTVTNCYNTGTVTGSSCVGGVVGFTSSHGPVTNCYNTGTVSGNSCVGGVVGYNSGTATNCYNTGSVSSSETVGGVVGYNYGTATNCYNIGTVSGSSVVGGVGGYNSGTISNCYYDNTAYTGAAIGWAVKGGTATDVAGKTTAQFATGEVAYLLQSGILGEEVYDEETDSYITLDPEHIWGQTIGEEAYPVLKGDKVYQITNCKDETVYSNNEVSGQHTDTDNSGRCDTCDMLMQPAKLCFASISLKGNIAINYYMLLSDEVLSDSTAYMQFTLADGEIIQIPVSEGVATDYNGETYYKFTCAVNAKEMTDIVLSQFFYEGGSTTEFSYTVKTYADYIITNSANANEVALAKAMLHYGAAAQMDFDYNTDDLANADLDAPDYSGVSIEGFTSVSGQGTELATFYSASLILKSETTLRFFFTGSITATYSGQELEVKERNGLYYVDVVGIAAKDLDEDVTITINDGTNTADVTYNPMAYCTVVQNDTTGTADQAMKDLVAALYLYNQAANTYFEEN